MLPRAARWAATLILAGCSERDRLTFPTTGPDPGSGPTTTILQPGVSDTTLTPGGPFIVVGRTIDPDGVDSVFFDVMGGAEEFAPTSGGEADTVSFGLPVTTQGLSGATIVIEIHGVDALGNPGPVATRRLMVQ